MKCVSCGSVNLVEGSIPVLPKEEMRFTPGKRSLKDRFFGLGRKVRAYGCLHCNYLQFAVDFEPGDSERFQAFDGVQPSVIERLEGGE